MSSIIERCGFRSTGAGGELVCNREKGHDGPHYAGAVAAVHDAASVAVLTEVRLEHTLELAEGERQVVLMALAALSIERPGWDHMLNEIARRIDNDAGDRAKMYDEFRELRKTAPPEGGKCCTIVCSEPATHAMHWPGAGRKLVCPKCCERAIAAGWAMGFELETEKL